MDNTKAAIHQQLIEWRDRLLETHYPNCGFSITAPVLLSDSNIDILADCATPIQTMDDLNSRIRWRFSTLYGQSLLEELARIYASIDFSAAVKPPPPKKSKRSLAAELLGTTDNPSATNATPATTNGSAEAPPPAAAQASRPTTRGSRGGSTMKGAVARGGTRGRGQRGRGRGRGSVTGREVGRGRTSH